MIEPAVWLPSAAGTMRSATAAAEPADEPPGVWARLRGLRVLGWRQQRELRRHRLAHDDGAGAAQGGNARRVALGAAAGENRRAVLGRQVGGVEDVLDADRHAMQRRPAPRRRGRRRRLHAPAPARGRHRDAPRPAPRPRARRCDRGRRAPASSEESSPLRMASAAAVVVSVVGSVMRGRLILSASLSRVQISGI